MAASGWLRGDSVTSCLAAPAPLGFGRWAVSTEPRGREGSLQKSFWNSRIPSCNPKSSPPPPACPFPGIFCLFSENQVGSESRPILGSLLCDLGQVASLLSLDSLICGWRPLGAPTVWGYCANETRRLHHALARGSAHSRCCPGVRCGGEAPPPARWARSRAFSPWRHAGAPRGVPSPPCFLMHRET